MKLVKKCYLLLAILALFSVPNKAHAQFWGGFLQGVGAALQNYNNQQRYNNYQSSQNYVKKASVEKHEIRKKRVTEIDGFEWIKVRTWNGNEYINFGAQNSIGESIIPQKYSLISYHISKEDGWFCVFLNDKKGVYDVKGHCICEAIYDDVNYYEIGNKVYVKVKADGKVGIVGEHGQFICEMIYDDAGYVDVGNTIYFRVKVDGKIGIVGEQGQMIIQPNAKYNETLAYIEKRGTFFYKNSQGVYEDLGIDIWGNHRNSESSEFPLASEVKHKIVKTFLEDENRDFIGNGDVVIGKNTLVINLGMIKQEYKYIGKPKQTSGLKIWTVNAVYNGTKGKLDFADLGKEIMIKPSGFNMPVGYIVKR